MRGMGGELAASCCRLANMAGYLRTFLSLALVPCLVPAALRPGHITMNQFQSGSPLA
jgi:hypothetical protein